MKITKKQQAAIDRARIQKAVTGLIIPIMEIGRLSSHLECLISAGVDDATLASEAAKFFESA